MITKNKVMIILGVFSIVLIIFWFILSALLTTEIKFKADDVSKIEMDLVKVSLRTEDRVKIDKLIGYLNKIKYRKIIGRRTTNKSPDYLIYLYDKNSVTEVILIYGNIALYEDNQYIIPIKYLEGLEDLCLELNNK